MTARKPFRWIVTEAQTGLKSDLKWSAEARAVRSGAPAILLAFLFLRVGAVCAVDDGTALAEGRPEAQAAVARPGRTFVLRKTVPAGRVLADQWTWSISD
jgi:hypothetical protein